MSIVFKEELKNKAYVLEKIKFDANALQYASNELKGDIEFILEAIKHNEEALQYVSDELKGDKEFVLKAVKRNAYCLKYVLNELNGDREIVLEAVKQNAYSLQYASDELKADKEIVLEAIKHNICTLKYESDKLNADRVVWKVIKQYNYPLEYASNELKADREIVLEAIKQDVYSLQYALLDLPDVVPIFLLSIKYGLDISNDYYFGKPSKYWKKKLSGIYNKSFDELEIILRSSKLTLTDAGAKVFTISKEFNENTISMISMDGGVYTINNIDIDITFNRLADELYQINNSHNNIAFVNDKGKTFDLSNFNKSVIDSI